MADKAPVVEMIDGLTPGSTLAPEQAAALERFSKYEMVVTDRTSDLPPYTRLSEGHDIVAVSDKATGWTGVVQRNLVASIALDERRTARSYRIVGFKECGKDEALAIVWAPRQAEALKALGSLAPKVEEPF